MLWCQHNTIFCIRLQEIFQLGVAVVPETDEAGALFGKLPSELQSGVSITNGVARGTLAYVTGYTGFSGNVEEQSGNYIALKVTGAPEDAVVTYQKVGGSAEPVTLDADRNIVIRVVDHNAVLRFTVSKDGHDTVRDVDVSHLTYEEAEG